MRSERKLVTILFADIRGSLELIHGHDPEQVSAMLESRVDLMIQAVQTFDGTVSRVMGDGIMAMFGAPRAAEHHALRACLSALRIRETAMQPTGPRDVLPAIRSAYASGLAPARSSSSRWWRITSPATTRTARSCIWRRAWSRSRRPTRSC